MIPKEILGIEIAEGVYNTYQLYKIFTEYKYDEPFLREVWDYIWGIEHLHRHYHFSKEFLREWIRDWNWTDIIVYNNLYTYEEKEKIIKEFDLVQIDDEIWVRKMVEE